MCSSDLPNPMGEYVYSLLPDDDEGEMDVEVFSMYGTRLINEKVVVESHIPTKVFVDVLKSGMYTLRCTLNSKKYQFSLVKK